MGIGRGSGGISGRLSNFTSRKFIFDGVECNSIDSNDLNNNVNEVN